MPSKERKPKELLANQELLGFTQLLGCANQIVQRASSAKVTLKSALMRSRVTGPPATATAGSKSRRV